MSGTMQETLQRDREENPGCQYSSTSSQTYQMVNGETVAQRLQRIVRHCKGQAPVEIFNNSERTSGDSPRAGAPGRLPGADAGAPGLEDFVQEFRQPLEGLLGGFGLFGQGGVFSEHGGAFPGEAVPAFGGRGSTGAGERATPGKSPFEDFFRTPASGVDGATTMPPKDVVRGKVEEV